MQIPILVCGDTAQCVTRNAAGISRQRLKLKPTSKIRVSKTESVNEKGKEIQRAIHIAISLAVLARWLCVHTCWAMNGS